MADDGVCRFEKEFDGVQDVFELQVCAIESVGAELAPQGLIVRCPA